VGTDQPVPTPARCRARQASPASSRLIGEKTALVEVDVALSRNAIMNKIAATKPSIARSFRLEVQRNKGSGIRAIESERLPELEVISESHRGPGQLRLA
jgi:hypothetical protein